MANTNLLFPNNYAKLCSLLLIISYNLLMPSVYGKEHATQCPNMVSPVVIIGGNGYYNKGTVKRDSVLFENNNKSLKPIYEFQNRLSSLSDNFVRTKSSIYKTCADAMILKWAKRNALSKFGSDTSGGDFQSNFVQQWTVASLGLARLKLGPLKKSDDDRIVINWLKKTAISVYDFHKTRSHHNNHYNWAVLAVGSVGISTNDDSLVDISTRMFDVAIAKIKPGGFLPLEMKRQERASSYHSMAAQPLAMYHLIRNQCAGGMVRSEKLIELINLVKAIKARPQLLNIQAGVRQLPIGKQPWINVWDIVIGNAISEEPSSSRFISGSSQTLAKVLIEKCPALS